MDGAYLVYRPNGESGWKCVYDSADYGDTIPVRPIVQGEIFLARIIGRDVGAHIGVSHNPTKLAGRRDVVPVVPVCSIDWIVHIHRYPASILLLTPQGGIRRVRLRVGSSKRLYSDRESLSHPFLIHYTHE